VADSRTRAPTTSGRADRVGFFDDLEALGRLGRDLAREHLASDAEPRATAPALFFECVCGRKWTFALDATTPRDVLAWIERHVTDCAPARTWVVQTKRLASGE
jgi:hypothetical protein